MEDESTFLSILVPLLQKRSRMVTPVAKRVEMVRCVVPVVEAVPVTLSPCQLGVESRLGEEKRNLPGHQ